MKKFLKAIKSFFLAVKYCFPLTPGIRYYRHEHNARLYILASEKYIKPGEERKMIEAFPSAIACSLFRFNFILLFYDLEIITIGDDEIIDEFHPQSAEEIKERELLQRKLHLEQSERSKQFLKKLKSEKK